MPTSLVDVATAADILALEQDAFATDLVLGNTKSLVLYRDSEEDGTAVAQPAQTVLMVLSSRPGQPRYSRQQILASEVTSQEGEFQKFAPFNVAVGDRFTLDGIAGEITAVFPTDNRGVARAAFELQS